MCLGPVTIVFQPVPNKQTVREQNKLYDDVSIVKNIVSIQEIQSGKQVRPKNILHHGK